MDVEVLDNVFFGVMGDRDDFFCGTDGIANSEVVGQSVVPFGHFATRKKRKGEVMDGDNVGSAVEDGYIEMRKMNKVEVLGI